MKSVIPHSQRLHALDSLRGVAAVLVVIYHLTETKLAPTLVPHGYLAVDFFFMLSGIVLAGAYEKRLQSGMKFSLFLKARFIRLYPMSIAGALAGLVVLLLKYQVSPDKVDQLPEILISGALNTLLLPNLWGGAASKQVVFPGNGPLWSLFFEMLVNVIWALFLVRARNTFLWILALLSGFLYGVAILGHGTANLGWDVPTFLAGFPRVTFGFVVGILLYRIRQTPHGFELRARSSILALVLTAILVIPGGAPVDIFCIFLAMPVLAYLGASPAQQSSKLGDFLGDLSYPLYALHFPILLLASGVRQIKFPQANSSFIGALTLMAAIVISWVILKQIDEPLRRSLSMRFLRKPR